MPTRSIVFELSRKCFAFCVSWIRALKQGSIEWAQQTTKLLVVNLALFCFRCSIPHIDQPAEGFVVCKTFSMSLRFYLVLVQPQTLGVVIYIHSSYLEVKFVIIIMLVFYYLHNTIA